MTESTDGPKCPYCSHVHEADVDVVSYWGTVGNRVGYTCENCGKDFDVVEIVERSWESFGRPP